MTEGMMLQILQAAVEVQAHEAREWRKLAELAAGVAEEHGCRLCIQRGDGGEWKMVEVER
jgi:hypothetical protein